MTYTYCDDTISDLHKDAYGFRPGSNFWSWWNTASDDEKQDQWDSLIRYAEAAAQEQREHEEAGIAKMEALIAEVIELGAKDRLSAIRWLFDGSDANGDWDYFAWKHNLPYRYFAKEAELLAKPTDK